MAGNMKLALLIITSVFWSCYVCLLVWLVLAFDSQFAGRNVSPPDMQEQEQKIAKVQSWIQGYLQAVQDLQNS